MLEAKHKPNLAVCDAQADKTMQALGMQSGLDILRGQGHMATGLMLVIAAKISGTAMAARLFQLTEPALMRPAWFARLYGPWKRWKDRMLAQVRDSAAWRAVRQIKRQLRAMAQNVWAAYKGRRP